MEAMAGSLATVLICDDEPSLRELIRISLDGPYPFAEADDGEESLEIARRLRPDVVILDMMMPRLSGLEVLTEHPPGRDSVGHTRYRADGPARLAGRGPARGRRRGDGEAV